MKILIVTLLVASPVYGQSRIYTNADLGKPLIPTSAVTSAEAATILAPYQFFSVPPRPLEPTVAVVPSSPTSGPFGEFKAFDPPRRLDGSSYAEPPWSMTTHVGWRRYSLRYSGSRVSGLFLPSDRRRSMTPWTIVSPQPEWRTTPETASGGSSSHRRTSPRD